MGAVIVPQKLRHLKDVDDSTPADGDALVYDGASQSWKPGTVSGGGGGSVEVLSVVSTRTVDYDIALDEVYYLKADDATADNLALDLTEGVYLIRGRTVVGASATGWTILEMAHEVHDVDGGALITNVLNDGSYQLLGESPSALGRMPREFGGGALEVPAGKTYRVWLAFYVFGTWFGTLGGASLVGARVSYAEGQEQSISAVRLA